MNSIVDKKDLLEGIKFLKKESLNRGAYLEIAHCTWIMPFSLYMSTRGLCLKFWKNTILQGNIHRIKDCQTLNDVCYGHNKCLFTWSETQEGHVFWANVLCFDMPNFSCCNRLDENLLNIGKMINEKLK